ncbi:MAG: DUF5916 domain-containing protein [Thermoanaerobaculia bacterium]
MSVSGALLAAIFSSGAAGVVRGESTIPPVPPPLSISRAAGSITIDGRLTDPGWKGASVIDRFWETQPGDDTEPPVQTIAYVTYDDRFFYIGLDCRDPHPEKIRAPYVDRDNVIGTDDNVAIFLDTRNDHRAAIEFRVNPRGIQADASYNDANGNEDFSPDYFYDTAAEITEKGWTAEVRIPFSSLRYPSKDPQQWGILVWRNYPREFRYAFHSSPIPRNSNCWLCREREVTGLSGLPGGGHLVVAPYANLNEEGSPRSGEPGSEFLNKPARGSAGLDVKWNPNANTALDGTVNPDFSQVESDIGQIGVNKQFALFFPEKRPFFLENVDLFDTPIQAVYTRTITSPRWGARDTGKSGATSYTLLVSEDRGGGSVILPGPSASSFGPQDFHSIVAIGRARQDVGSSFGGLLATDREIEGVGYNRVLGPDFQWRPGQADQITGQILGSATQTPDRPDLAEEWTGRKFSSRAIFLDWLHTGQRWIFRSTYQDVGEAFRADDGFVPQVGYRQERQYAGYTFYPTGFFNRLQPYVIANYLAEPGGALVQRQTLAGLNFFGRFNLNGYVEYSARQKDRIETFDVQSSYMDFFVQIDPSRRLSRLTFQGFFGQHPDVANARPGRGGEIEADATVKPTDHLELDFNSDRQWLNVDSAGGGSGRLFTAQIARLKATYNFSSRLFLRVIGQYLDVRTDPSLYLVQGVAKRSGSFDGSALFSYKLNWQTVFFVGYGDSRVLNPSGDLLRSDRTLFAKISYAFQR